VLLSLPLPKHVELLPADFRGTQPLLKTSFNITEARAKLPKLIRSKRTVSVSSGNKTLGFIVPRERMEALLETMEILANPQAMRAIRRDQSGKGKYLPLSVLDED
jgi:antitoxin YefM